MTRSREMPDPEAFLGLPTLNAADVDQGDDALLIVDASEGLPKAKVTKRITVAELLSLTGVGGVTNDAANTQIAVSDGTNLIGSANLTWNEAATRLGLDADENGSADIVALGVGAQISIRAADGDATHVGGEVELKAGDSAGESGGAVTISSGGDTGGGDSGPITIQTLGSPDGESGDISLLVGQVSESAEGGDVIITAGTGQTSDGGNVIISAGAKITGGSHGSVQIYSGEGSAAIDVGTTGVALSGGVGLYGATPVAQGAAIADATTAVDVIPRLNELLAYLRSRGDIAT